MGVLQRIMRQHILRQPSLAAEVGEAGRWAQHIHVQLTDVLLPRQPLLLLLMVLLLLRVVLHPLLLLPHQLQLLVRLPPLSLLLLLLWAARQRAAVSMIMRV
jgi:hypothetical protein